MCVQVCMNHYVKDILVSLISVSVIIGLVLLVVILSKRKIWKDNFRRIISARLARISLVVIVLYLVIFILDSVTFPVFREVEGDGFSEDRFDVGVLRIGD